MGDPARCQSFSSTFNYIGIYGFIMTPSFPPYVEKTHCENRMQNRNHLNNVQFSCLHVLYEMKIESEVDLPNYLLFLFHVFYVIVCLQKW